MYKIIFLFTLLSVSQAIFGQTDTVNLTKKNTKIEEKALKVGTIIKKTYTDLYKFNPSLFSANGGYGNVTIKTLSIADLATRLITNGLYFYTVNSNSSFTRDYTGYIDSDELSGLLRFLEFLQEHKDAQEPTGVEYIYTCNDIQFAAFTTMGKKNQIVWNYHIKVDRYSSSSVCTLPFEELQKIYNAIQANLEKLH